MKKIRTFFLNMDGCMERDLNLNLEFEMNKLKEHVKIKDNHASDTGNMSNKACTQYAMEPQ
jgi:hypothetical protein